MQYTDSTVYEFISKQTGDPIVERKTCRVSGAKFPIYQSDLDFYDKMSPTFDGKSSKYRHRVYVRKKDRKRGMHGEILGSCIVGNVQ